MVAAAQGLRLASLELRIAMGLELILKPSAFAMARMVLEHGSARSKLAQPTHILPRVVLRMVEILTMATTRCDGTSKSL